MANSDQLRSFIALQPIQEQAKAICDWANQSLQTLSPDVRLYPEEKLHLTLAFLGDRSPVFLQQLSQELQLIQQTLEPVTISIGQLKLFPSLQDPRYLALMVEPDPSLLDLMAKIERVLLKAGVEPESRSFRPHITLAKLAADSFDAIQWQSLPQPLALTPATAQTIVLFHSQLEHSGSIYQPIFSLELAG